MNPNLTVSDVVTWLRKQAREFNRIADTLEQTFSSPLLPASSPIQTSTTTPLKVQHMVAYLKQKGASRAKSMAEFFCVPVGVIEAHITENGHLFDVGERGWIKLAHQPDDGGRQREEEVQRELDAL